MNEYRAAEKYCNLLSVNTQVLLQYSDKKKTKQRSAPAKKLSLITEPKLNMELSYQRKMFGFKGSY